MVDRNGLQPCHVGTLPPQLAAYCAPHAYDQDLVVRAGLEGDRDLVYRAALMDPHTAANLKLDDIRALVDTLIEAHGESMPAGIQV